MFCSLDLLTMERYDGWVGILLTINSSYNLSNDNFLTMSFKGDESISYYIEVHDPNFHLNTYISLAIPRAYFRISLGEHHIGKYSQKCRSFLSFTNHISSNSIHKI